MRKFAQKLLVKCWWNWREQIGNLEPLTNLRVLMLGKNRIRRIEGLQKCTRLSVLDLHGNRITQVWTNYAHDLRFSNWWPWFSYMVQLVPLKTLLSSGISFMLRPRQMLINAKRILSFNFAWWQITKLHIMLICGAISILDQKTWIWISFAFSWESTTRIFW